jgi:adenylate kinase
MRHAIVFFAFLAAVCEDPDGILWQQADLKAIEELHWRDTEARKASDVDSLATVIRYDQNWKEMRMAGDYAFEWGDFVSVLQLQDGKLVQQQHNILRILKRDGHAWRVHRTIWNDDPARE